MLFSLPVKLGGLGIFIPSNAAQLNTKILIYLQPIWSTKYALNPRDDDTITQNLKRPINTNKIQRNKLLLEEIKNELNDDVTRFRALEASLEKWASNWLTDLSINEYSFVLINRHSGTIYIYDIISYSKI